MFWKPLFIWKLFDAKAPRQQVEACTMHTPAKKLNKGPKNTFFLGQAQFLVFTFLLLAWPQKWKECASTFQNAN